MNKEKLKIVIIGCGRFSQFFVPLFKAHPVTEKVWVCDLKKDREEDFAKRFGFAFTKGQAQAVCEIYENIHAPTKMNRLLQGDVGSGKTAVARCGI